MSMLLTFSSTEALTFSFLFFLASFPILICIGSSFSLGDDKTGLGFFSSFLLALEIGKVNSRTLNRAGCSRLGLAASD